MTASRRAIATAFICAILAIAGFSLVSTTPSSIPKLSITYLGSTNLSGKLQARFALSNRYSRAIEFAAGPVTIRGAFDSLDSNYVAYINADSLGPSYTVNAGRELKFLMPMPAIGPTQTWTAPIIYSLVSTPFDNWKNKIKTALHLPVGGPVWDTNTPEVTGTNP